MPAAVSNVPPLTSRQVAVAGGLSLLSLTLFVAFALLASAGDTAEAAPSAPTSTAPTPPVQTVAGPTAEVPPHAAAPSLADLAAQFPAEPALIPQEVLTRLELAGADSVHRELGLYLGALQLGFASRSVQVEPTLRSYAFRLAERVNAHPERYRVLVVAPTAPLAQARAAVLERFFARAGALPDRLRIVPLVGPHGLHAEPA